MNVFERLHSGEAIDIRDEDYQREGMENSKWFPEIHGNFGFGCMRLNSAPSGNFGSLSGN